MRNKFLPYQVTVKTIFGFNMTYTKWFKPNKIPSINSVLDENDEIINIKRFYSKKELRLLKLEKLL